MMLKEPPLQVGRRRFPSGETTKDISGWYPVPLDSHKDVSENSGFSPQIIHFIRVFHYKPSILGHLERQVSYFFRQLYPQNQQLLP